MRTGTLSLCVGRTPAATQLEHNTSGPPSPKRRRGRVHRAMWLAIATVLMASGGATHAEAKGCSSCPAPSQADVQQSGAGLLLQERWSMFGPTRDYIEYDGGECEIEQVGEPEITVEHEGWQLWVSGEVQNCPSGTTEDTVTIELSKASQQGWSASISLSAEFDYLAVKLKVEAKAAMSGSTTLGEAVSVSKTIKAAWCQKVPYRGFVKFAKYVVTVKFKIKRRYAWWTKNVATGDTVHQHGSIWVDCGQASYSGERRVAIDTKFELDQLSCDEPACEKVVTISAPDDPAPPKTPVITPGTPGTPAPPPGPPMPGDPEQTEEDAEDPNNAEEDDVPEDAGGGDGGDKPADEEDPDHAEDDPHEDEGDEPEEGERPASDGTTPESSEPEGAHEGGEVPPLPSDPERVDDDEPLPPGVPPVPTGQLPPSEPPVTNG